MAKPQFEVVEDLPEKPVAENLILKALTAGLTAMTRRALGAMADIIMLLSIGSVWWLWTSVPDPNVHQIAHMGIYAAFALIANFIVRRVR